MNKEERKRGFWKENYSKCWNFLVESKYYLLIISFLLIASFLFGYIFPLFFLDFIKRFIEQILEQTKDMNFFQLFIFILQNNLRTAFFAIIFGVFFGIFSIFSTLFNGYVIGVISSKVSATYGNAILFRLLPHGIFELPSLIISLALGLKLGMFIFSKDKKKTFINNLENSLRVFLSIILPLLIIAAFIEAALMFLWR